MRLHVPPSLSLLRRPARAAALAVALGAAVLAVGGAGCTDDAAVLVGDMAVPADLLGRWATPPEPNSGGSFVYSLEFGRDGRFVVEWRAFGMYPGQRAGDVSGYSRSYGAYRVDGDRLTMLVDRVVTWDRFYGADSPETVTRPQPATAMYDDARFRVEAGGEALVLDYTSYPADAPVAARMTFRRAP
jgi:hypothetical protein